MPTQTILNAPLGYIGLYTHCFSLANLRLPLNDLFYEKQQSLYNGKILLEKHDPPVVYDSKETLELAQEKADESLAKHKALELEIERLLRAIGLPKIDKTHALSKPVTSNSIPTPQESKVMKKDNVIALRMFRINPFKPFREEKYVPNKVRASVRTNLITVSQYHVITKKDVNYDSDGLSFIGVDNTTKTKRPYPKSNTKNDRVPSASKSSCKKN
nr:hypothetical protein [Tanacetum cinerariifolium]